MSDSEQNSPRPKRSLTSVTLGWIADKLRRSEEIKQKLADGTYSVDTRKVAAAIANEKE